MKVLFPPGECDALYHYRPMEFCHTGIFESGITCTCPHLLLVAGPLIHSISALQCMQEALLCAHGEPHSSSPSTYSKPGFWSFAMHETTCLSLAEVPGAEKLSSA